MVTSMTNMMPSVVLRQRLPAPHWAGGFGRSYMSGAEALRRPVHGFFCAFRFMVDGISGSLRAWRSPDPLDQPVILSAALSLVAFVGGLNYQSGASS